MTKEQLLSGIREEIIKSKCWNWPAYLSEKGYARRKRSGKMLNVHRVIFQALIRDIPEGLVTDHLCRNRACVNPFHLEMVTNTENVMRGKGSAALNSRKTHCKRGHPLEGKNVRTVKSTGWRFCVTCKNTYQNKWRRDKRYAK